MMKNPTTGSLSTVAVIMLLVSLITSTTPVAAQEPGEDPCEDDFQVQPDLGNGATINGKAEWYVGAQIEDPCVALPVALSAVDFGAASPPWTITSKITKNCVQDAGPEDWRGAYVVETSMHDASYEGRLLNVWRSSATFHYPDDAKGFSRSQDFGTLLACQTWLTQSYGTAKEGAATWLADRILEEGPVRPAEASVGYLYTGSGYMISLGGQGTGVISFTGPSFVDITGWAFHVEVEFASGSAQGILVGDGQSWGLSPNDVTHLIQGE